MLSFAAFREFRVWPDELVQRLRTIGEIFANALARKRADQDVRPERNRFERPRTNSGCWPEDSFRRKRMSAAGSPGRCTTTGRSGWRSWPSTPRSSRPQLDPSSNAHCKLQEMRGELVRLSEDVHALSRHLHPSILDDLGLVDALPPSVPTLRDGRVSRSRIARMT